MKLDYGENSKIRTQRVQRLQRYTKHMDALGFVVLGGLRAGSATNFSKTHVITHETCEVYYHMRN